MRDINCHKTLDQICRITVDELVCFVFFLFILKTHLIHFEKFLSRALKHDYLFFIVEYQVYSKYFLFISQHILLKLRFFFCIGTFQSSRHEAKIIQ